MLLPPALTTSTVENAMKPMSDIFTWKHRPDCFKC